MSTFLEETHSLNFNHPDFNEFLKGFNFNDNPTDNAKEAYFKIRDHFLYDPYHLDLSKNTLVASEIINKKRAWCVEKALIMVACCRAIGIPAMWRYFWKTSGSNAPLPLINAYADCRVFQR
jgi:transglutaminase-like putative cysteine protease